MSEVLSAALTVLEIQVGDMLFKIKQAMYSHNFICLV